MSLLCFGASLASYTPLIPSCTIWPLGRAELDGNGSRRFLIPKNLRFAPGTSLSYSLNQS